MAEIAPSRHEKSLGLLTTKFVSLLQQAHDGVLDLKQVMDVYFVVASLTAKCARYHVTCNWRIFVRKHVIITNALITLRGEWLWAIVGNLAEFMCRLQTF